MAACGGSILDATHILTAAHCVDVEGTTVSRPASDVTVVAGDSNVSGAILHDPGGGRLEHPHPSLLHAAAAGQGRRGDAHPLQSADAVAGRRHPGDTAGGKRRNAAPPGSTLTVSGYGLQSGAEGAETEQQAVLDLAHRDQQRRLPGSGGGELRRAAVCRQPELHDLSGRQRRTPDPGKPRRCRSASWTSALKGCPSASPTPSPTSPPPRCARSSKAANPHRRPAADRSTGDQVGGFHPGRLQPSDLRSGGVERLTVASPTPSRLKTLPHRCS